MFRKRGKTRQQQQRAGGATPAVVGTEAKALENMEHNRKHFHYPEHGFCNPIEHSLVYSIITAGPKVYPESVALQHIKEENFLDYLKVQSDGPDSYAQLSAILAVSADKFPPPEQSSDAPVVGEATAMSISQALCKAVLQCVVKYAEEHGLDRQTEVDEVLMPVEKYVRTKLDRAQLKQVLPFYLGYTATLITLNPIPMMVGLGVTLQAADENSKESENMSKMTKESTRIADVETAGLLDEDDLE